MDGSINEHSTRETSERTLKTEQERIKHNVNLSLKEKSEICKGYADLIIKKEKLIREVWETEFAIKKLENILRRNKMLNLVVKENSETEPTT